MLIKWKLILKQLTVGNESGFTLLEALIAMFVFSVGILATASLQSTSIHSQELARQNTEAAAIAASIVEDLRPLRYVGDAELNEGNHILPAQGQYNVSYSIQRDAVIDNTMLIQVTVAWTLKGSPKTYGLVAIKPDII